MLRFETPLALTLIPLLAFVWWLLRSRLATQESFPIALQHDLQTFPQSFRARSRNYVLGFLKLSAMVLLVVALARPQSGATFIESEASGRDLLLVLDLSGSMQAMDFYIDKKRVNRLQALQKVVKSFIDKRRGDRIGLIVFGDQVFLQCPPTTDQNVLKSFVDSMQIGMAGSGTALGDALAVALKRLRSIDDETKTVVLVTDGKSNSGRVQPLDAARVARELGIKVHTIGIGEHGVAPFPVRTFLGGTQLVPREVDFDEETLVAIAELTGGVYASAKNIETLGEIYNAIDRLEKRDYHVNEYIEYEELFLPFALIATLLFFLGELLSSTFYLRVP